MFCVLLFALSLPVEAGLQGNPPVTRFVPTLDIYPQNFAIAQDSDSIIYIGNTEGVLIFDGERWQLVALPNNDIVRSLAYDGQDRVYVGGYNCFGYLERGADGVAVYHDLTHLYANLLKDPAFADIWDIQVTPYGVFFRAVKNLFQYVPASGVVRLWRHEGRFGAMGQLNGAVLVQFRGEGLKRYEAGDWVMAPGGEVLKKQVYKFLPLAEGGLLTLARDGSWHLWRNGKVTDFAMPPGFPASSHFSAGRVLEDGSLVLGTADSTLYFLQPGSRHWRQFRLEGTRISEIVPGNGGGLLAISNPALFRVAWPTRWTVLGAAHGLKGSLNATARWGNNWFVLTGAGVYAARQSSNDARPAFQRLDWTSHEAWDLLALDANSALLAESYDLQLIKNNAAQTLSHGKLYPRILLRSRFDPDLVYIGTELGFAVLHRQNGVWRLLYVRNDMQNLTINNLVETAPREVWMGSERGGVWRLRLSADYSHVADLQRMTQADGLDYGNTLRARVALLDKQKLVVSTAAGLYHWTGTDFVSDGLHGLNALRQENEVLTLAVAPNGDWWAYSNHHIYHRRDGGQWQVEQVNGFLQGALQGATYTAGDMAVFAATNMLLRYTPVPLTRSEGSPAVLLRSAEYVALDGTQRRALPLDNKVPLRFTQDDFGIALAFTLPDYRRTDAVRYQARLVPYEQVFSSWSDSSRFMYSRLEPGSYRFELRGRDSLGRTSEITPFRFTIVPHWYASNWARIVWLILLLTVLTVLVQWRVRRRTRRLAGETSRLEGMVMERTRALESANRQLDSIAHLDGLTEIPNRRRLDNYLGKVWQQCLAQQRTLAVLIIDVDHFKSYNDRHGHLAGDDLLKRLAAILSRCLRRGEDLVARYGGEEFLVVLPGADIATAQEVAETMRAEVEYSSLGATISIGVAARQPRTGELASLLVSAADAALYEAKAAGRNRVVKAASFDNSG